MIEVSEVERINKLPLLEALEEWVDACDRQTTLVMRVYSLTDMAPDEVIKGMRKLLGVKGQG